MGNFIILTGIILIFFGLILNFIQKYNLPLLPGDILIQKENFTLYFPIVTSLVLSVILTIIFIFLR